MDLRAAGGPGRAAALPRAPRLAPAAGGVISRVELPHPQNTATTVLARSGRYFAVSRWDRTVTLYDASTGRELLRIPHTGPVARGLDFAPDDRTIAVPDVGDTV